jgi:hypothetical protein
MRQVYLLIQQTATCSFTITAQLPLQLLTNGPSNCLYRLQAFRPLLQAIHDLAVCVAAGLGSGCKEGMVALQQQLQQESLDGETLPPEGEQHWLWLYLEAGS